MPMCYRYSIGFNSAMGYMGMIEPDKLFTKAMDAAEDLANKEWFADDLQDGLDAIKADIIAELKAKGESVTLIPALAKKDPRYKEVAKGVTEAKHDANLAKYKYDQVNRYMDNIRTKESTERALAR